MRLVRGLAVLTVTLLTAAPVAAQGRGPAGQASPTALASARAKEDAMRRPRGPTAVTLSAEEMASLIEAGLDPAARRALDSVRVELHPGRLTLRAFLVTEVLGAELLGPMAYMLNPLEPMTVSGPARVSAPGRIAWEPDSFAVRSFSLPAAAVPRLVNRLTGGRDGSIPIVAPPTVNQVRIDSRGVTFSRR
jgi:hypothetical protein